MSLASGFESGFNLALKFNQQQREEEKQEKQFELMDVQIEAAQDDIEASKEQREYTKENQTNAMDSFHFREWLISQEEE